MSKILMQYNYVESKRKDKRSFQYRSFQIKHSSRTRLKSRLKGVSRSERSEN